MATQGQASLREAVDEVYRTFSRYKIDTLTGCPHCTSDDAGRYLASKRLAELTAEDLRHYALKAMTTWGSVEDFKHFLPRLLELVASGAMVEVSDVEVVFGKLAYGKWRNWPAGEREAIGEYLRALWLESLQTYPHPMDSNSLVCAIGQAEDDLAPYLDAWTTTEPAAAARHLADLIDANQLDRKHFGMRNAYWDGRRAQADQVWRWLLLPERKVQFERAFFAAGDDPKVAAQLSDALQTLELIQQVAAVMAVDRPECS